MLSLFNVHILGTIWPFNCYYYYSVCVCFFVLFSFLRELINVIIRIGKCNSNATHIYNYINKWLNLYSGNAHLL